ncbi:hypothetical protein ABK040_002989 [Willaertia magna]
MTRSNIFTSLCILLIAFLVVIGASSPIIKNYKDNINKILLTKQRQGGRVNNRPIIGIFAQPTGNSLKKYGNTYIPASYVKFIESAGARVVPIPYHLPQEELRYIFESINGILFPGGGTDLTNADGSFSKYALAQQLFIRWSIEAYEKNQDYFPVWGTCLGMQGISIILANDGDILVGGFDSYNISMPLNFTSSPNTLQQTSRIFKYCPDHIMGTLMNQAVTLNNHHFGVEIPSFNAKLSSQCNLLAVNKDRKGRSFVSLFEHKKYPIYASQFHPEKISFEWYPLEDINHSFDSVIANNYFAQFFVDETRKNLHQFDKIEKEQKALIYNYTPVYTGLFDDDFVQCYFFN